MEVHIDQQYIRALLSNNSQLIEKIYEKCGPQCIKFIKNNGGTNEDARDIFQNTVSYVYSKAKSEVDKGKELILTAPICAYLYPIYKGRWLNELKIRARNLRNKENSGYIGIASDASEIKDIKEKQELIFMDCFKKLPDDIKQLFNKRYTDRMTSKEIATQLNIDDNTVNQRFSYYKQKLKDCAEQHPNFNDLKE